MNIRKITALIFIYMTSILLFAIPVYINPTYAEVQFFTLEDSFEGIIDNRIYSKYDNGSYDISYTETLTLKPNSDYATNLQVFGSASHYGAVDETTPDEDTTYIYNSGSATWQTDLFDYPDHTTETETILYVNMYMRVKQDVETTDDFKFYLKTHATNYAFDITPTMSYATYNKSLEQNPFSSTSWTWSEIDDMIAGVTIYGKNTPLSRPKCTQFYIDVVYNKTTIDEEYNTYYKQDTSYFRAYDGLYSFYHSYQSQYVLHPSKTVYSNSSIIVDCVSVALFPSKISFNIYSNILFNLSLIIDTTTFIVKQNINSSNTWYSVTESILREDYLLNSTDSSIYFEFQYDREENVTMYIDNLKIRYTDTLLNFNNEVNSISGTDLNDIAYNFSDTSFNIKPNWTNLGVGEESINADNDGIYYKSESNKRFTRRIDNRIRLQCDLSSNSTDVEIIDIFETIDLSVDKEYTIYHYLQLLPIYSGGEYWINLYYGFDVYTNGLKSFQYVLPNYWYSKDTFNNSFDTQVYFQLTQLSYSMMSIDAYIENMETSNITNLVEYYLPINTGNIKTSFIVSNFTDYIGVRAGAMTDASPTIDFNLQRKVTHSMQTLGLKFRQIQANWWWLVILGIVGLIIIVIHLVRWFNDVGTFLEALYYGQSDFSYFFTNKDGEGDSFWELLNDAFGGIYTDIENTVDDATNDNVFIIDMSDITEDFQNQDWNGLGYSWQNMFPTITKDLLTNMENLAFGFWGGILGFPIMSLWGATFDIVQSILMWLMVFIVIYIVYIMKRILARDWDRLGLELTRLVKIVKTLIDAVVFIFHWIFEIIHAILDVAIPFT